MSFETFASSRKISTNQSFESFSTRAYRRLLLIFFFQYHVFKYTYIYSLFSFVLPCFNLEQVFITQRRSSIFKTGATRKKKKKRRNPRRLAYIIAGNRWLRGAFRERNRSSKTVRSPDEAFTRETSASAFERGNKTSCLADSTSAPYTRIHTASINVRDNGTKVYHYLSTYAYLLPRRPRIDE